MVYTMISAVVSFSVLFRRLQTAESSILVISVCNNICIVCKTRNSQNLPFHADM